MIDYPRSSKRALELTASEIEPNARADTRTKEEGTISGLGECGGLCEISSPWWDGLSTHSDRS